MTPQDQFKHSLQDPKDTELQELHCNGCDCFFGYAVLDAANNDIWEIKVTCWDCRQKQMAEEERVSTLATN